MKAKEIQALSASINGARNYGHAGEALLASKLAEAKKAMPVIEKTMAWLDAQSEKEATTGGSGKYAAMYDAYLASVNALKSAMEGK